MNKVLRAVIAGLAAIVVCSAAVAEPQLRNPQVLPGDATANARFKFSVQVDPDDFPDPGSLVPTCEVGQGTITLNDDDGDGIWEGAATSSPMIANHPDLQPVELVDFLTARGSGAPQELTAVFTIEWADEEGNTDSDTTAAAFTVHDAYAPDYGGLNGNRDSLISYPKGWPAEQGWRDPLTTDGGGPIDDDGASSSIYTFSVHYKNLDALPPILWFPPANGAEGVYLALAPLESNDYMDTPGTAAIGYWTVNNDGGAYDGELGRAFTVQVQPESVNWYAPFLTGHYHWFWSASDDKPAGFTLTPEDPSSGIGDWDFHDEFDPPILRPGEYAPGDPPAPLPSRNRMDLDILVDRPVLAPDPFYFGYPFASTEDLAFADPALVPGGLGEPRDPDDPATGSIETHPFVTVALRAVADKNDPTAIAGEPLMPVPVGGLRFLGGLEPYKRVVNPGIPNQGSPGNPGNAANVLWSETAGGTESQLWTFRVIYQGEQPDPTQPDKPNKTIGRAPAFIRIKIFNTPDGSGTPAIRTMTPETPAAPTLDDYKTGVIYKYEAVLSKGPHSFSFEASDGTHTAVFPRRPSGDGQLPAEYSPFNDVINGPYVNSKPVLSNASVSPASGLQSDTYVYRVTYSDPDGHKPYSTDLIIETDTGNSVRVSMTRVGTSTNYKQGVQYQFSAAEAQGTLLNLGVRHYYFEFEDDWGRVTDPNDRIRGELVRFPSTVNPLDASTWLTGPTVVSNNAPTLSNSKADPDNALSFANTEWTFQTTYSDVENQEPSFVNLVLGRASAYTVQASDSIGTANVTVVPPDPGTPGESESRILNIVGVWDNPDGTGTNYYTAGAGGTFDPITGLIMLGQNLPAPGTVYVTYHATPIDWTNGQSRGIVPLVKLEPGDIDYTNGTIYVTGEPITFEAPVSPNPATAPPMLYYYAFEAADGLARARYAPDSARPSPGAFDIESEVLTTEDDLNFEMSFGDYPESTRPNPVAPVVVGPLSAGAGNTPLVLEDVLVTLTDTSTDPWTTTVLTKGDGATKNECQVDYARGIITLGAPAEPTDIVRATYWFGDFITPVQYNNPPTLTEGYVTPVIGSQTTTYTYSVVYTERDGLNGTAPTFVRVIIDGVAQAMTRVTTGEPIYRNGVEYRYQTTLAPNTSHRYRFEASDGYGYAVFDAGTPPSRNGIIPVDPVVDIQGPFLNDAPQLLNGLISPASDIRRNEPVTYSVYFRDTDNDPPASPYPMTWVARIEDDEGVVQGPGEWLFNGGILSTVENNVTLVSDSAQSWSPSQFRGQPLTWTTGKRVGQTDTIVDNTQTVLMIRGQLDLNPALRPEVSDRFAILESSGTVTEIDYSAAAFADNARTFVPGELAGAAIQMVTGNAIGRVYNVAGNTDRTMAISARLLPAASPDPTVQADGVRSGDTYSINDRLVGAVTLNLDDGGVVSLTLPDNPGWADDQFIGLPVQILSGTAAKKNYTILSNTADKLFLAQSSNLVSADGLQTGDLLRVAGLEMAKVNPIENDYTTFTGVQYRVTVPGLGLGQHAARWLASNSPVINGARTTFQASHPPADPDPEAEHPGWLAGPLVVSTTPPGNLAPVLANALAVPSIGRTTDDYFFSIQYKDVEGDPPGPHDGVLGYVQLILDAEFNGQIIRRTYRSSVDPVTGGTWPKDVFRTIDSSVFAGFHIDADVTPLPPGTHRFHFEASDGWSITRFPANPANDPSVVVNSRPVLAIPEDGSVTPLQGNAGTTFRFRVIYFDADNQAPGSLGLVLTRGGVDQPTINITQQVDVGDSNYIDGALFYVDVAGLAAGTYTHRFIATDGPPASQSASPTLPQAGPTVRAENVAPELIAGTVTPGRDALDGNLFTYSVRYRDPNGDVPAYVRVRIFTEGGGGLLDELTMAKADPADNSYADADGVLYELADYTFATSGTFQYEFRASDGLLDATGDIDRKIGPVVNNPPELEGGSVTPLTGLSSELFTFSVTYLDADNEGPAATGYVRVILARTGGTTLTLDLEPQADTGWDTGVEYRIETQIPAGTYSFHFEASDGYDEAADTPEQGGLVVTPAPELRNPSVSPAVGRSIDTYIYRVIVANPDGTAPTDVRVFIDGEGPADGHAMTKTNPSATDFAAGVEYRYETQLSPGEHTWVIRAIVGGETIFPAGQSLTNPAQGPRVNHPPVLANATVSPTFGSPSTDFTFEVRYSDADGVAPAAEGYVRVIIAGIGAVDLIPTGTDWSSGVIYRATRQLPAGQYSFYFEASDGIEAVRLPTGSGSFDGPRVSSAPQLSSPALAPQSGTTQTTFIYSVVYTDQDNDPPAPGSVRVLIDGQPFTMSKQLISDNDYTNGATYVYTTKLSSGTHNYMFQASDGVDLVATGVFTGPTVTASGITINASPSPVQLGGTVTLTGDLLPQRATQLTVTLARPTGQTFTKTVASDVSGHYSTTFVADEVGQWTITVHETTNTGVTATLSPALTVQPATLRVQGGVIDMISSPVTTPSGDPATIFGAVDAAALSIVRWDPLTATYKFYGSAIDFPVLGPGSGFWIRPTSTRNLTLSGSLADQTQPVSVQLYAGWNQIGSGFVQSVDWTATQVRYNGQTMSLAQAAANEWVRDYAWGYNPQTRQYFLVRASGGAATTLDPFRGYWIRALVPVELLVQPPSAN